MATIVSLELQPGPILVSVMRHGVTGPIGQIIACVNGPLLTYE